MKGEDFAPRRTPGPAIPAAGCATRAVGGEGDQNCGNARPAALAMHVLRPPQPLGPPCMSCQPPMHVLRPHVLRPCPAAPCPAAPAAPSCGPCGPCSRVVSRGAGSTTATLPLAQPARLAAGCARCRVAALTDVHGAAGNALLNHAGFCPGMSRNERVANTLIDRQPVALFCLGRFSANARTVHPGTQEESENTGTGSTGTGRLTGMYCTDSSRIS